MNTQLTMQNILEVAMLGIVNLLKTTEKKKIIV